MGDFVWVDVEADGFLYNMVRSITGTLVLVGMGRWPESRVAEALAAEDRREAGPTAPAAGAVPGPGPLRRTTPDRPGRTSMKIVHVITRLILGGAQENTLLTVDGLHHRHGDDVTLITGPAEGPEGDLFDRAERQRAEGRGDARAGPRDPAGDRLPGLPAAPPVDPPAPARGGPHAQLEGRDPRPGRGLGRAGPGRRPHDPRPAVRAVGVARAKNRLYVALERWAARRCHAIVGVCDAMAEQALAAGVGRPEQYSTVYSGMDVDAFLEPAPAPRRGPPRAGPGRRRGRLRDRRPAVRAEGARRHPGRRPGGPARPTPRSGSSSSATASSATA